MNATFAALQEKPVDGDADDAFLSGASNRNILSGQVGHHKSLSLGTGYADIEDKEKDLGRRARPKKALSRTCSRNSLLRESPNSMRRVDQHRTKKKGLR